MTPKAEALLLAGVLVLPALASGCSGAGVPAERLRGESVRSTATDHLSAVVLVRSWFAILHQREAGTAAARDVGSAGCDPHWEMEFLPDGSMHMWGTNSDCGVFDYLQGPDGSGSGTVTWPDGGTATMTWTAPVWEGSKLTQDLQETLRNGAQLDYSFSVDFGPLESPQTWEGSGILPDGRSIDFVLSRSVDGEDHLSLALPDGSQLEVRVPLEAVAGAVHWPVFSEGAQGTFTPPSGIQQDFTLTGDGDRWASWRFTSSDGTEGAFTLGEDFNGSGQLEKGGTILGALRWDPTGSGTLELVAIESVELAPSAAARDFQIDQWISTIAAMGPMPVY